MSLDFSPVKMSSSSRTTSSVFQMITLSSNLGAGTWDWWYKPKSYLNWRAWGKRYLSTSRRQTYFFGFLGEMSRAGPGAVMSFGNMSTHISILPWGQQNRCRTLFCQDQDHYLWVRERDCCVIGVKPVQFPACQDEVMAWFPHAQGSACSRPWGFPPSGLARSERGAHLSASSNLLSPTTHMDQSGFVLQQACDDKNARCKWWSPFSSSISVGAMKTRFSTFTLPAGP